jgi:hypothetical protein
LPRNAALARKRRYARMSQRLHGAATLALPRRQGYAGVLVAVASTKHAGRLCRKSSRQPALQVRHGQVHVCLPANRPNGGGREITSSVACLSAASAARGNPVCEHACAVGLLERRSQSGCSAS